MSDRDFLVSEVQRIRLQIKSSEEAVANYSLRLSKVIMMAKARLNLMVGFIDLRLPYSDLSDTWNELVRYFGDARWGGGGDYGAEMNYLETERNRLEAWKNELIEAEQKLRQFDESQEEG